MSIASPRIRPFSLFLHESATSSSRISMLMSLRLDGEASAVVTPELGKPFDLSNVLVSFHFCSRYYPRVFRRVSLFVTGPFHLRYYPSPVSGNKLPSHRLTVRVRFSTGDLSIDHVHTLLLHLRQCGRHAQLLLIDLVSTWKFFTRRVFSPQYCSMECFRQGEDLRLRSADCSGCCLVA